MNINIPFLVIFLVMAGVHLFFCLTPGNPGRPVTKALLMPLLLVFYLFSAGEVSWLVVAALVLGWGGDVFLIFPGKKPLFLAGLCSFLLGHVAYAAELVRRMVTEGRLWYLLQSSIDPTQGYNGFSFLFQRPLLTAVTLLCMVVIGVAAYLSLHKHVGKDMKLPVVAYLVVILCMAGCASLYAFRGAVVETMPVLVFLGSLLFVTSDYTLARGLFIGEKKYGAFAVMLTYLAAQFLIVFGLCAV